MPLVEYAAIDHLARYAIPLLIPCVGYTVPFSIFLSVVSRMVLVSVCTLLVLSC